MRSITLGHRFCCRQYQALAVQYQSTNLYHTRPGQSEVVVNMTPSSPGAESQSQLMVNSIRLSITLGHRFCCRQYQALAVQYQSTNLYHTRPGQSEVVVNTTPSSPGAESQSQLLVNSIRLSITLGHRFCCRQYQALAVQYQSTNLYHTRPGQSEVVVNTTPSSPGAESQSQLLVNSIRLSITLGHRFCCRQYQALASEVAVNVTPLQTGLSTLYYNVTSST
ncbi:hypothetical protein J6590_039658 [Homalodisca vitripennis]|nr:hypothetical protein J6590_039658 [Homalodisca vitripennis]